MTSDKPCDHKPAEQHHAVTHIFKICNVHTITSYRVLDKLESSHSPQVPPPRQCYSPAGVTISTLPAVPLCSL